MPTTRPVFGGSLSKAFMETISQSPETYNYTHTHTHTHTHTQCWFYSAHNAQSSVRVFRHHNRKSNTDNMKCGGHTHSEDSHQYQTNLIRSHSGKCRCIIVLESILGHSGSQYHQNHSNILHIGLTTPLKWRCLGKGWVGGLHCFWSASL